MLGSGSAGRGLRDTSPVGAQLPVFIKDMGEEAESRSHPEIAGSSAFHKEARVPEYTVTGRGSSPAVGGQSRGLKLTRRWAKVGAICAWPCTCALCKPTPLHFLPSKEL